MTALYYTRGSLRLAHSLHWQPIKQQA